MDMFDCAIIGTGAAGVSAALTLKALKRNFVWIGNTLLSDKIRKAEKIKNYPGLCSVSGEQMRGAFAKQLENEGIEITQGKANGVYSMENYFTVACGQSMYSARSVILASGVESVKPLSGEKQFLGKGVSYCAVCDGFLYRGKEIAAIVTVKDEEEEVRFLAGFARKVYLFPLYKEVGELPANVEVVKAFPVAVEGDERVRGVLTSDGTIAVDGVFMLKNSTAADNLIAGLKTEGGAVKVDRACRTNIRGIFAAGDCTGKPYQYAKAVGEGNVAAHSVNEYLNSLKQLEKSEGTL